MWYLFFQTWIWIVGAFIVGMLFGWWICGRCYCNNKEEKTDTSSSNKKDSIAGSVETKSDAQSDDDEIEVDDSWQPKGLSSKPKDPDDLKRVKGIGPVIEKTLHGLGIYHFQQIADFNSENIAWVDKHISFPGRIDREEWVAQAKKLAAEK